jgi:hypothetical protein
MANLSNYNFVSGNTATFTGNITGNYFIGNGSQLTGVPTIADLEAFLPTYNGNLNNVNTVIAIHLEGEGGNIGNIQGANVTGTVANATVAASANSVAGANVTGTVASATVSASANSVAGANVTGTVASATVAASANSVAGANVSGQVANALVAGTVYTNAQPNITSVGTLTSLAVTGNVSANYFIGNGSQLTSLPVSAIIANGNSNVSIAAADGPVLMFDGGDRVASISTERVAIGDNAGITAQNIFTVAVGYEAGKDTQGIRAVAVGYQAGADTQGANAIAIGATAAATVQGDNSIAVGSGAGSDNQGNIAIAIGLNSGVTAQGALAIAIGGGAGLNTQGNDAIAIGADSGSDTQGANAIAIGSIAGSSTQGANAIAIGVNSAGSAQGENAIAIGQGSGQANQGTNSVAIGAYAGEIDQPVNSIIINASGSTLDGTESGLYINPVRNDTGNTTNVVYYNTTTSEVTYGPGATPYGNTEVAAYLPTYTGNLDNVTSVGNATTVLFGDGANITGLPAGYSNADVANYLPTYTGNLDNVSSVGNATTVLFGDGANITGLPAQYGNAEVSAYLASGSDTAGFLTFGDIQTTTGNGSFGGNVDALAFSGDGAQLTNIDGSEVTGQVANALVAGTVYEAAQPNITSVGTLVDLTVNSSNTVSLTGGNTTSIVLDSANGYVSINQNANIDIFGNITTPSDVTAFNMYAQSMIADTIGNATSVLFGDGANITGLPAGYSNADVSTYLASGTDTAGYSTAGDIVANNIIGSNVSSLGDGIYVGNVSAAYFTGNGSQLNDIAGANVTGQVANALVAGTVYTAAQPAITSVGTLTALEVSGNATVSGNLVTDSVVSNTGTLTLSASGTNQNVTLAPTGTGVVDVNSTRIIDLASPVDATDAATKSYVDSVAEGLQVKEACAAATPDDLAALTSNIVTYDNGTAGVGATLTLSTALTTLDGVTLTNGARVLVKNEATPEWNGIYTWATGGTVLTRATDYDTPADISAGSFVFISDGTLYAGTGWVEVDTITTIGTDPIDFTQFSGAGSYTAGAGLALNGTEFSVANTTVTPGTYGNASETITVAVNSRGQLTSISQQAVVANAATLSGTTLNSTVVTSSLTSVGTLTGLTVSGVSNLSAVGNVIITGGTTGQTLTTNGSGNLSWASPSRIANGSSSVAIASSNGSITFTLNGESAGFITNEFPLKSSVALGVGAGTLGNGGIAIGYTAGSLNQGFTSIAIGPEAGRDNQGVTSIAIGTQAAFLTQGDQGIAIGVLAGSDGQGVNAIAIGASAGKNNQPANSIIINATGSTLNGTNSGLYVAPVRNDTSNVTNVVYYNTTTKEVTYGPASGGTYNNSNVVTLLSAFGSNSISTTGNVTAGNLVLTGSITKDPGSSIQLNSNNFTVSINSAFNVAISSEEDAGYVALGTGSFAGGTQTISIGYLSQATAGGANSISVGTKAGQFSPGAKSIAIGQFAGAGSFVGTKLGANTIAIGYGAANGGSAANVIILNASGANFTPSTSQANSFYVNPVRNDTGNTTNVMYYNTTTKEVTYGPGVAGYGNADVVTLLGAFGSNSISTTGNIVAATIGNASTVLFGDGANIAGLPAPYTDTDVSLYLASGIDSDGYTTTGNIASGNINTTGIVSAAQADITGNVSATGNVSGGNLTTTGTVFAVGNVSGGNLTTGGVVAATGNITTTANVSANNLSVTANIASGNNITAVGNISANGNIIVNGTIGTGNISGANNISGLTVLASNAILVGSTVTTLPNTVARFGSNANSYTQITFQNLSTGSDATSDIVLTTDNGNDTVNFADFGIINSAYDPNTPTNSLGNVVFASDAYLYAQGNTGNTAQSGGNLVLGATVSTKNVKIFAGGNTNAFVTATFTSTAANLKALNVAGTSNLGPVANVTITGGTNGQVLTTNGSNVLSWTTVSGGGGGGSIISNGTSNVSIATVDGNITMAVGGTAAFKLSLTDNSITIGTNARGNANNTTSSRGIAIGQQAAFTSQGSFGVAIGYQSGFTTQGSEATAVGTSSGYNLQAAAAVGVGAYAGYQNQGASAVAVGTEAGNVFQGINAVAIGRRAGATSQGTGAIAIGYQAGYTSQAANTIIINATGASLDSTQANSFYIAPVRNDTGNTTNAVYYNTTTKEVTYGPGSPTYLNKSTLTGNTTMTLSQAGQFLYSTTSTAQSLTIPTNASVAFPVGTTVTVVLQGTGSVELIPASGVSLYLGGNSTSATRTVSPYGIATLLQVAANTWFINGTGVY